ncbi:MAG: Rho termination factor N-terminal domain-containing protein [Candidatus Lokiarchaeota archaeon]|nr:Rho termination factor N-terminal domain-containing protein [Candidatus Lokiarchaeota archaeon]
MNREIDDRTYLNFLLQSLNIDDLKQICRDFEIKGFSKLKKSELIDFILDSLAEEELKELIQQKEIDIISDEINLALKKINGEDRESVAEIKIINPDNHEIELLFKGFSWEVQSYLSITPKNIQNPERDCDCRIGSNMGLCSHFWIGFIYSLKQNWFKLKDWSLTALPNNFEENIKSIKLINGQLGEKGEKIKELAVLIDESSSGAKLMSHLDSSITVYECEITEIVERESEFQGNVTRFFMGSLKDAKFGPKLKKSSDFREEDTQNVENLKVRISEKLQSENNLKKGDKVSFNGKLVKDNFWGYIVKNVRKISRK